MFVINFACVLCLMLLFGDQVLLFVCLGGCCACLCADLRLMVWYCVCVVDKLFTQIFCVISGCVRVSLYRVDYILILCI